MTEALTLHPIGHMRSSKKYPMEAARQATYDKGNTEAYIELLPGQNFEQALLGLASFSHLWVIYQFHHNQNWKPIVQPPRGPKQGVFATRSPHRPNPLGMSAVEIQEIKGLRIYIKAHDILDGTPIFDIKPYHVDADSIPSASRGWLAELEQQTFALSYSPLILKQLEFIEQNGMREIRNFLIQQLEHEPLNLRKKRVFEWQGKAVIAYRTWRILFSMEDSATIQLEVIYSGYSEEDLTSGEDRYQDKALHSEFNEKFESRGDLPRFAANSDESPTE
jgi:tRNA-Thr(GGU) m(6)t(6)A37 methyltransferase TsaA